MNNDSSSDFFNKRHKPPQLCMVLVDTSVGELPDSLLPAGYEIRDYHPGDESGWADLINQGDFDTTFTASKVLQYMESKQRRDGSRIVVNDGEIVAATFATMSKDTEYCKDSLNLGTLDFVVTHPSHRGLGLGRIVCMSVLKYFADIECTPIVLHTDDFRLPAVSLYLSMRFEPNLLCGTTAHIQMPENQDDQKFLDRKAKLIKRWDTVRKKLNNLT